MICHLPQNYSSPIEYQNYLVTTMGVPLPPTPTEKKEKKQTQKSRTPPQKQTTKKKKKKKIKKEGAIFANPPSEDPLVYEPL